MDKLSPEAIAELDAWMDGSLKKLHAQSPDTLSFDEWAESMKGMESGMDYPASVKAAISARAESDAVDANNLAADYLESLKSGESGD